MKINLVVIQQFADFGIGEKITDTDLVEKYAASHPMFVVKVVADEPPPAIPMAKPDTQ